MQAPRPRTILWDSHPDSSKFIIAGGGELRLYEWELNKSSSAVRTLSVVSELSQLRACAWSAHTGIPDLVAVGLTTGRTLLLRLDAFSAPSTSPNEDSQSKLSAIQISPRHSRPCNVVSFCGERPSYLAVGLEKARGESLLVFDIEVHSQALASGNPNITSTFDSQYSRSTAAETSSKSRNASPTSTPASGEPRPIFQFGSSETVSSATFLVSGSNSASPLLVAGMGGKWLRAFDLRTPPITVATWATRSINSISPNPHNGHQFASYGDDGVIKLWDLRKTNDALLSFSEYDAGAIPARIRSSNAMKPLVDIVWDPSRRGILASLEKESSTIRVWHVADGPVARLENKDGTLRTEIEISSGKEEMRLPTVLSDQRSRSFRHPLASFSFAQSPSASPTSTHFVGVSRDTASPGTSGHRIEIVELLTPQQCAFLETSLVISNEGQFSTIDIPTATTTTAAVLTEEEVSPAPLIGQRVSKSSAETTNTVVGSRGRSLSLTSIQAPGLTLMPGLQQHDRSSTPRPSGSITPRRLSRVRKVTEESVELDALSFGGLKSLSTDPAVLLRVWVEKGYGSNPALNASLTESSLREFWNWITRSERLTSDACLLDYDFRYRGVLSLLLGFQSCTASLKAPTSQASSPSRSPSHSIYNDVTRSLRKGDESRAKDAAYSAAAMALVSRRRLDASFQGVSSQFPAQRKLALQACGEDWEDSFETVALRYTRAEDFEGAARFALFSGQLEKAMQYLRSCSEERLRMITPVLAAYISQKDGPKGSDSVYSDLCRSLSSDVETPWVRAMFAFLASGEWRELVEESGLPLKDRVAVAIRSLSDSELIPFLQGLGTEFMTSGDLEGVLLLGLRSTGLDLLQSYLNRTADVQTIALASSFVSPGLNRLDKRLSRWIESYRSLLDKLQLYTTRAMFDGARGRRARLVIEQAKGAGRTVEAQEVNKALRKLAPPQILIRCQFCSVNVSIPFGDSATTAVVTRERACAGVNIVDMEDMSTTFWNGSNGALCVLSVVVTVTVTQSRNTLVAMYNITTVYLIWPNGALYP